MKKCVIYILLALMAADIYAADSTAVITRIKVNADVSRLYYGVFKNTSLMGYRYKYRLTDVSIDYIYNTQSVAVIPQAGRGYMGGSVAVTSFQPLRKGAVWGGASYTRGKLYDVQYCETSDFLKLAPYVMADTVGGDLSTQSYKINGGFNVNLPRGFDIAAEASYRATIEARQKDPRPKNIVSDLKAQVAASYAINDSLQIGVDINAGKYKQTNVLKFYSELGVPNVVHITGLGTRYYRFDGSNYGTYYNGYSVGAGVGLLSKKSGFNASARYNRFAYTKIITSLNELPLTDMVEDRAEAELSYRFNVSGGYASIGAEALYTHRTGTENVFGDAVDNIYNKIASIEQYHLNYAKAGISANYGFTEGIHDFSVSPEIRYLHFDETYMYPSLGMHLNYGGVALKLNYMLNLNHWHLHALLGGEYNLGFNNGVFLGDSSAWNAPVTEAYNNLSKGFGSAGVSFKAAYSWRPDFSLYIKAAYKAGFYTACGSHTVAAAFGVMF